MMRKMRNHVVIRDVVESMKSFLEREGQILERKESFPSRGSKEKLSLFG